MTLKASFIFILSVVISFTAEASKTTTVEPAVGLGQSILGMTVSVTGDDIRYEATNRSFVFVDLSVNRYSFQAKAPMKDPSSTRETRGDTQVQDFQFGINLTDRWDAELYYQKYKGYFAQVEERSLSLPDLSFSHYGGQLFYSFNPDYSPSIFRGSSWKQTTDGGSFTVSLGMDRFELSGDLVPSKLQTELRSALQSAEANSETLRVSYGYNWFWTHWFAGVGYGGGVAFNQIEYSYPGESNRTANTSFIGSGCVALGYRWKDAKVGVFGRYYTWDLSFDDKKILSNTSTSGLYYSWVF